MVQDGGKKKKNKKNKNKNKQPNSEENQQQQQSQAPLAIPDEPVETISEQPTHNLSTKLVNGVNTNNITDNSNNYEAVLRNLAMEAKQRMGYDLGMIQDAEDRYHIYLAKKQKVCHLFKNDKFANLD